MAVFVAFCGGKRAINYAACVDRAAESSGFRTSGDDLHRFLATARNRLSRPRSLLALAIARSPGDAARGGGQSRRTLGREQRVKRRERRASHYAHCELSSSLPLQGMSGRGSASPAMRGCPARGLYDLNGGFIQWTQIRWMRPYPSITDPTTLSFTPKHYIHEQKLFCEGPPC